MNILVIDSQGGGVGKEVIAAIRKNFNQVTITAVGTNSTATAAMLRAGADHAATGENSVIVGCRYADIIIGPIGIVIADSLFGEITPKMSVAIGQSNAVRLLIPMNQCDNIIAGATALPLSVSIKSILEHIEAHIREL